MTVVDALTRHAAERGATVALRSKRHGLWQTLTFAELAARVSELAGSLRALGVEAGAPVALVAENSPEWIVCDLAIQALGATSVALPPQTPPEMTTRLLADLSAKVIVCGDQEQVDLVLDAGAALDGVRALLVLDPTGTSRYEDERLHRLRDLEPADAVALDGVGAIVSFSAGSEGDPRPARLEADGVAALAKIAADWLELSERDRNLTVLSLATPAARVLDLYAPLIAGAQISVPESPATVPADLMEVQPTVLSLSPRAVELLRQLSVRRARESSRPRRRAYRWGMQRLKGKTGGLPTLLIGRPVAADLGLRRTRRVTVTGGAVAVRDAEFFWGLGVPLLETYGQAELGGLAYAQASLDDAGTIGSPLPGISGRITNGELEVLSPAAGDWRATGDLAEEAGGERVRVRGRREDVGSGVVVAGLEAALGDSPYLRRAVVAGTSAPELTALVEVDYEETLAWASSRDLHFSAYSALVASDEVRELVARKVATANERIGGSARIADFIVAPRQLTVRDGELTAGLAIRRRAVIERFLSADRTPVPS